MDLIRTGRKRAARREPGSDMDMDIPTRETTRQNGLRHSWLTDGTVALRA